MEGEREIEGEGEGGDHSPPFDMVGTYMYNVYTISCTCTCTCACTCV